MDKKPNKIHENMIPTKIKQTYHTLLIHIAITNKKHKRTLQLANSQFNSRYMYDFICINQNMLQRASYIAMQTYNIVLN